MLYPHWLGPGDNAWQLTAATLVGLMSVPGLVVLYGGVMQRRWSVNSMMLAFVAFALVLVMWVLYGFKMGFGSPLRLGGSDASFLSNFVGRPGAVLDHAAEQGQARIPALGAAGVLDVPQSSLVYFQFVFAAIAPILMLGSVLGRVRFKAWVPFVLLWATFIYTVNAFLIWGGGWFAQQGAVDFSGGYVIHLAAGASGFVAAWVIGPRLARDREVDAPNNLAMVALGAGLLWLGWNGFNGGDPYNAGADASAAILNTNLATAVAFLVWVCSDYATDRKPSLIGSVNGMIVGLVAITPAAGFVNGYGAIMIGAIASLLVYVAYNYLALLPPFNRVDDTLGVVYTHGFAGLAGGILTGVFADSAMQVVPGFSVTGGMHLVKWQLLTGLWVISFSAAGTFVLLKLVSLVTPLRMTDEEMALGDMAVHGHEVYPSDIPSLAYPAGLPAPAPVVTPAAAHGSGGAA
jgi:ammonium transporter, Amt family